MAKLLLVANESGFVTQILNIAQKHGYPIDLSVSPDGRSASGYDAILFLLTKSSINELPRLHQADPAIPIIMITNTESEELTLTALQSGAATFLHLANLSRDLGDALAEVLHTSTSQLKRTMFQKRQTSQSCGYTLESDTEFISMVVTQAEALLQQFKLFDDSVRMQLGVAIHEALVNAMIHGNLEVSSALKLDNWDDYHRQIAERQRRQPYADRRVFVTLQAVQRQSFQVIIRDEGPGFDVGNLADPTDSDGCEKPSGRGMTLIRAFFDEVHHNERGNEITMIKRVIPESL